MAEKDAKATEDKGADADGAANDGGADSDDAKAAAKGLIKEAMTEWAEENKPTRDSRKDTTSGTDWLTRLLGF